MSVLKGEYPALWHFLGAYLHQDWRAEYAATREAVADFARSEAPLVPAFVREVHAILSKTDEDDVERLLINLGSFYAPSVEGQSSRQWLAEMADHAMAPPQTT